MKTLFFKNLVFQVFIGIFISGAVLAIGMAWSRELLYDHFQGTAAPAAEALSRLLGEKPDVVRIRTVLSRLSGHPEILKTAVIHDNGKMIFARGPQKRAHMIESLRVSFPVTRDGAVAGRLVIWASPELLVRILTSGGNLFMTAAAMAFFGLLAAMILFLYFKRNFYSPLARISAFIESLERDQCARLEINAGYREWKEMAARLNRLNDKMVDTNATLNMLFSVSQTLTSHIEMNQIFNVVLEIIQKKFEGVSCCIVLMAEDGFLKIRNHRGYSQEFIRLMHLRPGEGIAGQAFKRMETVVVNDMALHYYSFNKPALESEGIASFIHIPMIVESSCAGLLNVGSRERCFFTQENVKTLQTLAKYAAIALRNAQLYERVQELNRKLETEVSITTRELIQTNSRLIQKVREMKTLSDIAMTAAAQMNLSDGLTAAAEKIKELLSAQAAGFFIVDENRGELTPYHPFFGLDPALVKGRRFTFTGGSVLEGIVRDGRSFMGNGHSEASSALPFLADELSLHSLILVPLKSGARVTGILAVVNKFGMPFSQDDERIMELIGDRISSIMENGRLYRELEKRLHEMKVLQEIASVMSSEPEWERILSSIIATTTKAFGADLCALLFYDEKTRELATQPGAHFTGGNDVVQIAIPVDDPDSLSALTFRTGEPFLSTDASIDARIRSQSYRLWNIRSLIMVPLRTENRVVGVLRLGKHQPFSYTRDHLNLATLIAHQAAVILENAHLYSSLSEAKSQLEVSNEIKNEFIVKVSGRLAEPLAGGREYLKKVLDGESGELNAMQLSLLTSVGTAIRQVNMLVAEIEDIGRMESGRFRLEMRPVPPGEVLTEVSRELGTEVAQKGLRLECRAQDPIPQVMGDRVRLVQILKNLAMNSIKFTPSGGAITLTVQDNGEYAVFGVEDTGIGIDRKYQQMIFEKFTQLAPDTEGKRSGTGLGLAIVKSMVELHGGKVWVESEPGQGSRFMFIIPLAGISADDSALREHHAGGNAGREFV